MSIWHESLREEPGFRTLHMCPQNALRATHPEHRLSNLPPCYSPYEMGAEGIPTVIAKRDAQPGQLGVCTWGIQRPLAPGQVSLKFVLGHCHGTKEEEEEGLEPAQGTHEAQNTIYPRVPDPAMVCPHLQPHSSQRPRVQGPSLCLLIAWGLCQVGEIRS